MAVRLAERAGADAMGVRSETLRNQVTARLRVVR